MRLVSVSKYGHSSIISLLAYFVPIAPDVRVFLGGQGGAVCSHLKIGFAPSGMGHDHSIKLLFASELIQQING